MIEPMKAVAVATGMTAVAVPVTPLLLGIPAGVLLAACAGALFGLAYTKPELWASLLAHPEGGTARRALLLASRVLALAFTLAANALVSAWAVSAAPHVPGFGWTGEIPPVPLAGLIAFSAQHVIPRVLNAMGRWLDSRAKA